VDRLLALFVGKHFNSGPLHLVHFPPCPSLVYQHGKIIAPVNYASTCNIFTTS